MGGGKSRAICELAFDWAIEHPGILIPICRQEHTSIVASTRKTMFNDVLAGLPPELIVQKRESQGQDFIRFWNGSEIHFVGLHDPGRWFSSEIGALIVDQAEQVSEDTVVQMVTRLRQRCRGCVHEGLRDCSHMPHRVVLSFNPDNPGHWLQRWFILGAERTDFGFRKDEIWATDAIKPLGDGEFFFARAKDNPYLPTGYVDDTLGGMPELLRRRMLDGLWEFITGTCFFDVEALSYYQTLALESRPVLEGSLVGDVAEDARRRLRGDRSPAKEPPTIRTGSGPLAVYRRPVRGDSPHRYVLAVDTSSGGSTDFSALMVVDVETLEVAARYQAKKDPDQVAVDAYRLGRIYNNAFIVPEITGGWGFTVQRELEKLRYPRLYTRRSWDRLAKRWTDKLGWETTNKSRAHMLDTLEQVLRDRELVLGDLATVSELATFVRDEKGRPAAQPGCNDDLVMALAIAVYVALHDMPRHTVKLRPVRHAPVFEKTGY